MSYVRGVPVDFSAAKIREVRKIHFLTPGAETNFKRRQMEDQRLDERQDLTPLARGWAEFIIHSIIPTRNKSEITVARAVIIHSIIKEHDVRVEELIADNIAIIAEAAQGRSKLSFPSTIFRLCKEAGSSTMKNMSIKREILKRPTKSNTKNNNMDSNNKVSNNFKARNNNTFNK
ncbi:hypothetical protein PIB30_088059 [Stylosanthes scabra]|uniref:Putative plant transposon protein domain-containing protein n=1 Tax=Stylosanthes scabra TaxID=79078 RepID=A0ABU6TT22_9FABA|nr:hypothetical protein [Stylosanthes scabra]